MLKFICIATLCLSIVGCGAKRATPDLPPVGPVIAPEAKPKEPEQHVFRMPRDQFNDFATGCGYTHEELEYYMRFQIQHYDFDWVVDGVWARSSGKIYVADDVNDADEHFRVDFKEYTIWLHPTYRPF